MKWYFWIRSINSCEESVKVQHTIANSAWLRRKIRCTSLNLRTSVSIPRLGHDQRIAINHVSLATSRLPGTSSNQDCISMSEECTLSFGLLEALLPTA